MKEKKLKIIEIAGMLALCISLCAAVWAESEENALAEKLVRFHVIAVSDSEEEQAIKLEVRDSVLEYISPLLEGVSETEEAEKIIESHSEEIKAAAEKVSYGRDVHVEMGTEYYPTREYETFSLPAGEYKSLRVIIGEGNGKNWWCVVFPPLCNAAADFQSSVSETGNLDYEDVSLITENDDGYVLKFRVLELWGELKKKLAEATD